MTGLSPQWPSFTAMASQCWGREPPKAGPKQRLSGQAEPVKHYSPPNHPIEGTQVVRGTHCDCQSTEPRGEVIKSSSHLAIMHLATMFAGARLVLTMQSFQRGYIGGVVVRDEGFELLHGDQGINALCNGICHFILPCN